MTTNNIIAALHREFQEKNHRYFCSNTYCASGGDHPYGYGESDFLSITRAGLLTECEIKRSKSDYKADFKKVKKHEILNSGKDSPVQYFYYACPEDIISVDDIPPYAGLIYIYEYKRPLDTICVAHIIRQAPKLNKNHASDKLKLRMYESLQHKYFRTLSVFIKHKK